MTAAVLCLGGATPTVLGHAAPASAAAEGDAPTADTAVLAWLTARAWLDAFTLPPEEAAAATVELPDVRGVSIQIRRGGTVLGRGDWFTPGPLLLRRAMGRAMGEVMSDRELARVLDLDPEGIAERLTLDLECAGAPVPALGRSFREVASRLEPGIDGLAMRRGSTWVHAFPGRMLASGTAGKPTAVLAAMVAELGLAPTDLAELRRTEDVEVYRFPTIRLLQSEPGATPIEPLRFDVAVPPTSVTPAAVRRFADRLAARLIDSTVEVETTPEDPRAVLMLLGPYRPLADEHRPLDASPFDTWLAAYALLRFAGVEGVDRDAATQARTTAVGLIEGSAPRDGTPSFGSPRHAALAVLASLEVPEQERVPAVQAVLEAGLAALEDGDERSERRGLGAAMAAAALARAVELETPGVTRAAAARAIDDAWATTPDGQQIGLLPWIGIAELALAGSAPPAGGARLEVLRRALQEAQIGAATPDAPLDVRGGFSFTGRSGADAQSLRAAAGLVILAGLPYGSVREEAEGAASRLAAMRFAMQLAVRPPLSGLYRNPDRALWGIRESTWSPDQAPAAQAMALLFASEMARGWPGTGRVESPAPSDQDAR